MKFTKMHGIGNDYVYVNCFEETVENPSALAKAVSDRHFGIGSDGLILILPSREADVRMRIFNADGSEAEMCGNGIRCVAKYVYEHGIAKKEILSVETQCGIKTLQLYVADGKVSKVKVNMDKPGLLRSEIPMLGNGRGGVTPPLRVIDEALQVNDNTFNVTCVSMGNPHCVIFVDDVDSIPLSDLGPVIEKHKVFPERTNVHFVKVFSSKEVKMRTWERGSGETLACGTGASAVCVAGVISGRTDRNILAHLPGGDLEIEWAEDENVYMTGPATEVFTGEWQISSL
ncbi:MAG TPA: diaminopimelate epimerase [Candidatus Brocadiia bacterium]|nr:diaminopimelate epimerase [Candidatus Brocadiales bacterium]